MASVEAFTPTKKRSLDDGAPSTHNKLDAALRPSPQKTTEDDRASPAPSTLTSLSETPVPTIEKNDAEAKMGQPPAKKRKLTPQEKEAQKLERERKAQEKEDLKRLKAEEKQVKDEEKRKKLEEQEEKRREKDMKRLQVEEEKKKKERVIINSDCVIQLLIVKSLNYASMPSSMDRKLRSRHMRVPRSPVT